MDARMSERIEKPISDFQYDWCRDVALVSFADGMSMYTNGYRLNKVCGRRFEGISMVGLVATFVRENQRWKLVRMEKP